MNSQFWNERYSTYETVYGFGPNIFFRDQLLKLKPGRLLLPAEGEGRNALFASQIGWHVDAFDFSATAREKALALARQFDVNINYSLEDIRTITLPSGTFDVIGLIYVHLPDEVRHRFHRQCIKALNKGGALILEAFSKKQISRSSGGPKDVNMLYSLEQLLDDFTDMKIIYSKTEEITLDEGTFHAGEASVVRLVVQKD